MLIIISFLPQIKQISTVNPSLFPSILTSSLSRCTDLRGVCVLGFLPFLSLSALHFCVFFSIGVSKMPMFQPCRKDLVAGYEGGGDGQILDLDTAVKDGVLGGVEGGVLGGGVGEKVDLGKMIEELDQISWNFLWGDTFELKKVHWVSWEVICKPKDIGGLGIH